MTPEEMLMLAIQREGAATPDLGTAVAGGAALGTIGGMMAGNVARQPGRLLNAAVGRKPPGLGGRVLRLIARGVHPWEAGCANRLEALQ